MFKHFAKQISDRCAFLDRDSNPVAQEMKRLLHAQQVGIAIKLAKLTQAFADGDEQAIINCRQEVSHFLTIATGATVGLSLLEEMASKGDWQVREPHSSQKAGPGADEGKVQSPIPHYGISSLTLANLQAHLTQTRPGGRDSEPEWMVAATGVRHHHLRTLEQLIEIKLATQSAVRASFDMNHFMQVAYTLDKHGQALYGIFHSHRFKGPPSPSSTDWTLQGMLDELGYPTIQAVFSEDGYIRFFANKPFAIVISGKGVERVDHKNDLFKLTQYATVPVLSRAGDGQSNPGPGSSGRSNDRPV